MLRPHWPLALVAALACGRPKDAQPPHEPDPTQVVGTQLLVQGRVAVVGNVPFVQVVVIPADTLRPAVEVVGDLRSEIRAAAGAEVDLEGRVVGPGKVEAARYTIRSVAGMTPVVGVLELDADGSYHVRAEGGARHRIEPVPDGLREKVGAKLWVILESGRTVVQAFGVLREP